MAGDPGPHRAREETLLQILGALDRPTSGIAEFDGQDLAQLREAELTQVRAKSIEFIFQTFNLIPTLTAQGNVETALVPLHVPAAGRHARAAAALADVGLGDRAGHLPGELSGGQQQRVAIARALVKEPKVPLADEPSGNLDEDTRDELITLLDRLWRHLGLTLVVSPTIARSPAAPSGKACYATAAYRSHEAARGPRRPPALRQGLKQ